MPREMSIARRLLLCVAGVMITSATCAAERETLSLDGRWQIDDSVSPTSIPTGFVRTVPVPGLADMAEPEFKDVNLFDSRERRHPKASAQLFLVSQDVSRA